MNRNNEKEKREKDHRTTDIGTITRETTEQWWARISPAERRLAQVIAALMEEVTESKRIEIRREGGSIRARFIHVLQNPEPGCVSAIVLPERAHGGWN